ncbi:MAG: ribosome biogenesis factor YjgA [Neisseriaceae bacterium]|jgi:ribosome-associated protein
MQEEFDESTKEDFSKTKLKKHMEQLQKLGIELVKLSDAQLSQFELSDALLDAIKFAKTINSNGALRRHYQYIGKLMRNVDEEYIRDRIALVMGESRLATKIQHDCENWRHLLLESDDALNNFISKYPNTNIAELRQLVRSVRKELKSGQNKHYRELFKFIRELIQS